MYLITINHPFLYEMEKLCREFYPNKNIVAVDYVPESTDEMIFTIMDEKSVTVRKGETDKFFPIEENTPTDEKERLMAVALFQVLSVETGYSPEWGILTGIRPSKLITAKKVIMGEDEAERYFKEKFLVTNEKTALAKEVSRREEKIIASSQKNSFSLYISIPFCPTRCSYCSFVSHSMKTAQKLVPEYVELLLKEIEITGNLAKEAGLRLETVYYGGGTPTTLSAQQLNQIALKIEKCFDLSTISEYTVEAGRPDTITGEKLRVLKNSGVTRISINPQTFNDSVLEAIGRKHTSKQTVDSFLLARKTGFDNINMDLIAGLPTDTLEGYQNTLEKTLELDPENITVHTLAIKRSSYMGEEKVQRESTKTAQQMLFHTQKELSKDYFPYYMYRQSKSLGNLENVGWCKQNKEGRYNIFMMEECHSILSCGAGAVTKLKAPDENHIERIFNYKYPYEYISRFENLIERKDRIMEFCNSYTF